MSAPWLNFYSLTIFFVLASFGQKKKAVFISIPIFLGLANTTDPKMLWGQAWKFAQGMLNNFPSLGLDRIHQMLGMFIEGGFSESQADLKKFLDRKVNEGVLAYTAGEYKLLVK